MKQIYKIILICSFAFLPFSVMAQEDFSVAEISQAPILDSGLDQEKEVVSPQEESLKTEPPQLITPTEIGTSQPLIHIEQLGWNTFKFRSSYRLGLEEYETLWTFGDDQTSTQRIVHHTYAKPGVYQVRLEIITAEGERLSVSNTVQVGFFNLANWRLWILILLLAVIIIIASIIAGVTEDSVVKTHQRAKQSQPEEKDSNDEEETVLNSLTDDLGNLDSLSEVGLDTNSLKEELAFLEEMDLPEEKKLPKTKTKEKKKIKVTSKKKAKTSSRTSKTKKKKPKATKKATKTKSRSTKKKATTKKSVKK